MDTTMCTRLAIATLGVAALSVPAFVSSAPCAGAEDGTTVRPISDFLDEQDLSYVDASGRNRSGLVDWGSENQDGSLEWYARIDFMGLIDRDYIVPNWGESIGTTFSGQVTERVQADGRTLVHVTLHTEDAFCVVGDAGLNVARTVWGHLAAYAWAQGWDLDVLDTVDVRYDIRFLTGAEPGSALPRLSELLFRPTEDQEVLQQLITVDGTGRLRARFGVEDGTPGRLTMTQKNVNGPGFSSDATSTNRDPWPVSRLDLRAIGN